MWKAEVQLQQLEYGLPWRRTKKPEKPVEPQRPPRRTNWPWCRGGGDPEASIICKNKKECADTNRIRKGCCKGIIPEDTCNRDAYK